MSEPAAAGEPEPAAAGGIAVVLGRCDELRAEVYVRAGVGLNAADLRLDGTLRGPECRGTHTLPATAPLVDRGGGAGGAVGRALLTEPSYWTPELPSLYLLEARLCAGPRELRSFVLRVGLRRLGVRGRSFWLDGRRWVPRAVGTGGGPFAAAAWRTAAAAALLLDPPDELLVRADLEGVAVIARLPDLGTGSAAIRATTDRLAAWTLHPCVALAVVPRSWEPEVIGAVAAGADAGRGTMLLARAAAGEDPPPVGALGCDCLLVDVPVGGLPDPAWRDPPAVPLVACRTAAAGATLAATRRACDRFQAELAAWGSAGHPDRPRWDWAGYALNPSTPCAP